MKHALPGYFFPIMLASAVSMGLVAIPMMLRMVPRNRWYGIRTRRTMQGSDEDWYAANRTGGVVLLVLSCVMAGVIGTLWWQL